MRGLALLRAATAHRRSRAADRFLALSLAFVAGAINAGGFLAVGQYTSHMTGIVSAVADNLALGLAGAALLGLLALASFLAGAAASALLINWGRRHQQPRQYALPIAVEALLLLGFGVLGAAFRDPALLRGLAMPLLCFLMGLQNATITKLSGARMRTTHLTGMLTDAGIELGKLLYPDRRHPDLPPVRADLPKLALLARLVGLFFGGGVAGALGFGHWGYLFCVPLALFLLALALPRLLRRPGRA